MSPFLNNAWGALVACCPEDDCQHKGNVKTKRLIANLKKALESVQIDPERVHVVDIPAGDQPHYFAGYTEGRKSYLPGIAGFETIEQNHKLALVPEACALSLTGKPVHEDMMDGDLTVPLVRKAVI
jgi:hypothetical protein